MSCGGSHRHGLEMALLWLWCRLAATASIRPLAWEPPYAVGAAFKKSKKRPKKNVDSNMHMKRCSTGNHQGNSVKTTMTYHFMPVSIAIIKKRQQISSVGEYLEKREFLFTAGGNVNWCSHCGNSMMFLKKLRSTKRSSNSGNFSEENTNINLKSYIYSNVHGSIITLLIIAKLWKQLKSGSKING